MDVLVVHNAAAGSGDLSADEIERIVAGKGHAVRCVSVTDDDWTATLRRLNDLVLVAGGDGTVRQVFLELAGTDRTAAVVPLGTANNIALALGLDIERPEAVLDRWTTAPAGRAHFDVPVVSDGETTERFVEGVGGGLLADAVHVTERREDAGHIEGSVDDGLQSVCDHVARVEAKPWHVEVDGRDLSGDLLAVEVLNIPSIASRVRLAPDAVPDDGLLDVVLVREEDRDLIARHAEALRRGEDPRAAGIAVHRGVDVRLTPPVGVRVHRDDDHWVTTESVELHLRADGVGVEILDPR